MNKNLFTINESEKERILNLHISATKNQYLFEQVDPTKDAIYQVFYTKLGDKSKRMWEGTEKNVPKMTDNDKVGILQQVKDRINKRVQALTSQGKKGVDFNKELNSIKEISIGYKTEEKESEEVPDKTITIEIPYTASYPDITKQNPDLQNFYFKDNEVIVPEDRKAKFKTMVEELKKLIPQNEEITEIKIKAGSTTSQVPTQYTGPDSLTAYKTIEEGQKNNIKLADDRCKYIESALFDIIKEIFPNDFSKTTTDTRDAKPNNGPAYTETEREYFFGEFNKLDPKKKSEYDTKYGPYKGSYGSVMIVTKGVTITTGGGGETPPIVVNLWNVKVKWEVNVSNQKKRSFFRSSTGGGISVGGGKSLTNCAAW